MAKKKTIRQKRGPAPEGMETMQQQDQEKSMGYPAYTPGNEVNHGKHTGMPPEKMPMHGKKFA
jgi:hypothetical protein